MSEKDTKTKQYMRDKEKFADAFNHYLYQGKRVIRAEELTEMDSTEVAFLMGEDEEVLARQKHRDGKLRWIFMRDKKKVYCLLAVENQSDIHYAMPLKVALGDVISLEDQRHGIEKAHRREMERGNAKAPSRGEFLSGFWKGDKLVPVITLVIYYGAEEWDAPRSLREMYEDCDEEILDHAIDYKINLIAPYHMSDEELDQFHTELRQVMTYIKYSRDKEALKEHMYKDDLFKEVDRDTAELLKVLLNAKFEIEEGKEKVNMCLAEEQWGEEERNKGREEGRAEGRVETVQILMETMKLTLEQAMDALKISDAERRNIKIKLNSNS